jgi:hypothetical protein
MKAPRFACPLGTTCKSQTLAFLAPLPVALAVAVLLQSVIAALKHVVISPSLTGSNYVVSRK